MGKLGMRSGRREHPRASGAADIVCDDVLGVPRDVLHYEVVRLQVSGQALHEGVGTGCLPGPFTANLALDVWPLQLPVVLVMFGLSRLFLTTL